MLFIRAHGLSIYFLKNLNNLVVCKKLIFRGIVVCFWAKSSWRYAIGSKRSCQLVKMTFVLLGHLLVSNGAVMKASVNSLIALSCKIDLNNVIFSTIIRGISIIWRKT